jgi:hypothetical protein
VSRNIEGKRQAAAETGNTASQALSASQAFAEHAEGRRG